MPTIDDHHGNEPTTTTFTVGRRHRKPAPIRMHRIAHRLFRWRLRRTAMLVARLWIGAAQVYIHPGARIGRRLALGADVRLRLGAATVFGDDVQLGHRVTIDSISWWHDPASAASSGLHLGDRVRLGAAATVLGPVTIGADTVIAAGAMVVADLPPGSVLPAPDPSRSWHPLTPPWRDTGGFVSFPPW